MAGEQPRSDRWAPSGGLFDPVRLQDPLQDPQDDDRTRARAARALDHHVLRTVYLDLVGRPPFPDERDRWYEQSLYDLADELLGTPEFWDHWFEEQLYYFLLIDNFRPEMGSIQEVPRKLAEGRLSVRDALHRIALTSSFDLRNPGADTFVTVVMEQFCGVTVQNNTRELEIGKTVYDGRPGLFMGRSADKQSDVVRVAVEHKKAAKHFLEREHERLVRQDVASKELAGWLRRQHRDPYAFLGIVREWLISDGYLERLAKPEPKSNALFVRALFVDLLGRLPTQDEVEPIRSALDGLADSRPLRSVIVRVLLDSGDVSIPAKSEIEDPTKWVAALIRRLLGRDATKEELAAIITLYHEPDCSPKTILYALLSHSEYHSY